MKMRNEKLIVAREERRWTQEKAAEKIGVSRITYTRWEEQGVIPRLSTMGMACEAFKLTPEQLGFRNPGRSQHLESDEGVNRRKAIQEIGKIVGTAGSLLMMPQTLLYVDDLERLVRALTKPSSIDNETLRGLKRTTENYWQLRLHGDIASPGLLAAVLGHYRLITQILQSSLLPSTRTFLYAVASETALLAGMLSSTDMHRHDQGKFYFQIALVDAQQADNDTLYAAGLGRMGRFVANAGKAKDAQALLQEAQQVVMERDTFTLRAWLAAEEAEVQADIAAQKDIQHTSACFNALEKAEIFAGQIRSEEDSFGMYFDASRIPAYQGSCYMRLHHIEQALVALQEGLKGLESPSALRRAVLLDLAETSIQAMDVEQACHYMKQALEISLQVQALGSLERVLRFRQQLRPWSEVQGVRDIDEQLRGFNRSLI